MYTHRIGAARWTRWPAEDALQAGGIELDAAFRRLDDCSGACAPTDQPQVFAGGEFPLISRATELGAGTDRFRATRESQDRPCSVKNVRARSGYACGLCCRRTVEPIGGVHGARSVAAACPWVLAAQLGQLLLPLHGFPERMPCKVRACPPCRRSRPLSDR